jgi:hypothetical protein
MMTTVYDLALDTAQIEWIQKATLTTTDYGIQQTHGLFGSAVWWKKISSGELPTTTLSGKITKVYMGSMGDWPMFEFIDASGVTQSFTREAQDTERSKLYAVGLVVEVDYVVQMHKKSFPDGSLDTKVVTAIRIQGEQDGGGQPATRPDSK